jgi:hypothetical protein
VQGYVFNQCLYGCRILSVVLEGVGNDVFLIAKRVVKFVAILNPCLGDDGYFFFIHFFHGLQFLGVVVLLVED